MSKSEATRKGPAPAVLIAAASGRALAAAARRAGYRPLVVDLFDDEDTRALSAANCRAGDPQTGFDGGILIAALERLAEAHAPLGLVYGAGFEDRIELLSEIERRFTLFGNGAQTVRRAKNPAALARLCAACRVPHPEISLTPPDDRDGWLVKSPGGAGGGHVAPASAWRGRDEEFYYQRLAPGAPVSILCLCDGADMSAVGASLQWPAPAPGEPFRFGGCLRPAGLPPHLEQRMTGAARSLARALGLLGLNSFDFLVDGDAFALIEINPRPGATLDIFDDRLDRVFAAHIAACRGESLDRELEFKGAAAMAIAYARRPIAAMPALDWPNWAADRQKPLSAVGLYDPVCTIKASAAEPVFARQLVEERTAGLLDRIDHMVAGAAF